MLPDDTRRAVVTEDLADPMHRSTDDPRHPDARESDQADDTRQWAADEHRTDEPMHADPRVDGDHDSIDDSVRDDLDRDAVDRDAVDRDDLARDDDSTRDDLDRDAADRDGVGQDGSAGDGVHDDLGRDGLGADDATRDDRLDDGSVRDRDDPSLGDESARGGLTSSDAGMRDDALGDDLTRHDPAGDAGPRDGTMDDDLTDDTATAGGSTAALAAATPGTTDDDSGSGSLFGADEAERFKARWRELQIAFVDEPRSAVQNADELVAEVMQTLAGMFAANKQELEGQWRRDGEVETEDLRLALQKYRSFFDQLLRA